MIRLPARSASSPRGGTKPSAGALARPLVLLLAALTLASASTPGASTPSAAPACEGVEAGRLAYSLDLDATRDGAGTDVTISFDLLAAREDVDVAMLLFADGVQVLGPTPARRLACGSRTRWTTRLPVPEGEPLDLHASPHVGPGVPAKVARTGPDDPYRGDASGLAYDANDMASLAFGPKREPPRTTWASGAERRSAPLADAYLYDEEPRVPTYVRVLDPGEERWSFGIWFAETWRRDGTFALTCMVDDAQIGAFRGRRLWIGRLEHGEAALVEARTPVLEPGWHEVRCLVLDDLFAGRERGVAWPYVIRSAFVHRRP